MPDVFTMLKTDHRTVEALLDELADSEQGPKREALVVKVTQALQLHMQFEEGEVYPLLQQIDGEMEEEAEIEHGLARDGLAKMTELVAAPGFGAAVEMVKAGIEHHVEEEEQEAFPKLQSSCDDATVGTLGRTLVQRKAEAGTLAADLERATKATLSEMADEYGIDGRSSMTKAQLIDAIDASASSST
jgi:iron-sulfur cluster repair protein YtfE (RIC family)